MTTWKWLKVIIDQKKIMPQYTEDDSFYKIKLYDGSSFIDECLINKRMELVDKEDFETNYKPSSNSKIISGTLEWSVFKAVVVAKVLSIQWTEDTKFYYLTIIDGHLQYKCILDKNPLDLTDLNDFVNNYKALGNASFSDIDGIPFTRLKASKKGWSFWAVPIEITTSTLSGSVYCKDVSGTNIAGITCKIYDTNDSEITTAGLANINLAQCVKTVLDFEPPFDFEMIGGALRINSNPGTDLRLWIIGAPDIAAPNGSKEFASGVNLKFLAPDSSFEIDGRVTKYITYNPTYHTGKIRVVLKHPAGTQVNMQIIIHTYRQ